jgi:pimeloyl-ACP methyl ester carboxylesterase
MRTAAPWMVRLAFCGGALLIGGCSRGAPAARVASAVAEDPDPGAIQALTGYSATHMVEPEFGATVRVLEAGPADGTPVVLVHGLGDQGMRDFFPVLPAIARTHRVLAIDLPGFGRSTRAAERYTPERYVRSLHAITRAKIGRPFDLVGHSMGGALSLSYAAAYPADVLRLILVDVAGILNKDALAGLALQSGIFEIPPILAPVADIASAVGSVVSAPLVDLAPDPRGLIENDSARGALLGRPDRIAALALILHDHGPAIAKVTAPTLLVWGGRDDVAPLRTANLLRKRIGNARLVVLPESGHEPMRTDPGAASRHILERLDTAMELLRPLPTLPLPERGVGTRTARCDGQRGVSFEGEYAEIEITSCRDVRLRDVRTARLVASESEIWVDGGRIGGPGVAIAVKNSRLAMTGTDVVGEVGIEADRSDLDLAGVSVTGRRASVHAAESTRIVFSVSRLDSPRYRGFVHETRTVERGGEI